MSQAQTPARAVEVIRQPRHALRAACQHAIQIALRDLLEPQRHGFHPAGAGHVHGVGGNFFRNAAADGNLPGDIGPAPGLPRIAENGLLHLLARHSGALQRCPGRNRAHIRRRLRGQRAAKFADRRANGGEDENLPHLFSLAY